MGDYGRSPRFGVIVNADARDNEEASALVRRGRGGPRPSRRPRPPLQPQPARHPVLYRGARAPDEPPRAALQASFEEGVAASHQALRPRPHLRYNTPYGGQAPEIRPGASRARQHIHHPRYVLPRYQGDGWQTGRRYGRGAVNVHFGSYCCHRGFRLDPGGENSALISRMLP